MAILGQEELAVARELCLKSFRYFTMALTDPDFYDDSIHGRLCDYLQHNTSKDKLVIMPRVHLKTTIAATRYALWRATINPNIRILITCNIQPNAGMTLKEIRNFVENNSTYQALFPEVIPHSFKNNWSNESATLNRTGNFPEGTFESAGCATTLTRRHYDLIIGDDLVAPKKSQSGEVEQMPTQEDMEAAKGFLMSTASLLVRYQYGERLIIGTRWGMLDHIQMILDKMMIEKGGRFSVLDIPAIDESGKNAYKGFSLKVLQSLRQEIGEYMFSMLYLNKPLSAQFLKFRPENNRYYDLADIYDPQDRNFKLPGTLLITVDPADPPTGKADQCYTVGLAAYSTKKGLYVLDYIRGRYSNAELIEKVIALAEKWGAIKIRVEADRYPHLEAGFKIEMEKVGKHFIIESVKTKGRKKEDRIMRLTPIHENGFLFVRKSMSDLEMEMVSFPRGATIDILDALAWQVLDNFETPSFEREQKERGKHNSNIFTFDQIEAGFRQEYRLPFNRQLSGYN